MALAQDLGLVDFDPLNPEWAAPDPARAPPRAVRRRVLAPWGYTRERLGVLAAQCVERHLGADAVPIDAAQWPRSAAVLARMRGPCQPPARCLRSERDGPAAALPGGPLRAARAERCTARAQFDVLAHGRNFYSVDTRAVPTPTAYGMGALAADRVVERHPQDHGSFPHGRGPVGLGHQHHAHGRERT